MKKYFLKDTGEELEFGDVIALDFTGKKNGKKETCHLECVFCPEILEDLVNDDIVEIKEQEGNDVCSEDFDFETLLESYEELEKKYEELDERLILLEELIANKKTA